MEQITKIVVDPSVRWNTDIFKTVNESLPYYCNGFVSAEFQEDGLLLESIDANAEVKGIVSDLIGRISTSFRDAEEKVYSSYDGLPLISEVDPFDWMVEQKMIVSTGNGKFCYSGDFLKVFQAVEKSIARFAHEMGAVEELYPTTVGTQTLLKSGYLKSFPHHAFFASSVDLQAASLKKIADGEILQSRDREAVVDQLAFPSEVLAPTVCYHCFEARKDTVIQPMVVTALNKCHRHEPVNVKSLERLTTYWMREIIVFDRPEAVQDKLEIILEWTTQLLRELGITHKVVSANDPFFADTSMAKRLFQNAYELKKEVKVPVYGGKWLSVCSFNNHQKSILDKFNITEDQNDSLSSGCVGWGIERLIYGLLSHLGADIATWPDAIKKKLGL